MVRVETSKKKGKANLGFEVDNDDANDNDGNGNVVKRDTEGKRYSTNAFWLDTNWPKDINIKKSQLCLFFDKKKFQPHQILTSFLVLICSHSSGPIL